MSAAGCKSCLFLIAKTAADKAVADAAKMNVYLNAQAAACKDTACYNLK